MNKWTQYGQWRHPELWWEGGLKQYFKKTEPKLLELNPKVIKSTTHSVHYILDGRYSADELTKCKIIAILYPEQN